MTSREEDEDDDSKDKDKDKENDNGFCDTCVLGTQHDEMEAVINELNSLVDSVKDLNKQSSENLASTWEAWIKWFYDEEPAVVSEDEENCTKETKENTDDYYDTLQVLIDGENLDCDADGKTGEKNVTLRDCGKEGYPAILDENGEEIEVDELQGIKAWQDELKDKKKKYKKKISECEINPLSTYYEAHFGSGEVDYYSNYPCYDWPHILSVLICLYNYFETKY